MTSFFQYRAEIFEVLFYLHAAALVIVNITKTPKDDELLAKAYKVIEILAGLVGARVKQ